jgi:hypothetical protein
MDLSEARLQAKTVLGEIKPASNRPLTEVGREESSELAIADKFRGMTPTDFPLPELLHFGLTKLLDAKPYGAFEKMRWGFLFDFKDGTFGFELQKFGLRVLCEPSKLDSPLLRESLGRSIALTNVVEQYLSSGVIPDQINAGNFTVRNLYLLLRGRYEFLREKAELAYATPIPPPQTIQGQFGPVTTNHLGKPVHEGGSFGTAAVDAYFSMTEHLFVWHYRLVRTIPQEPIFSTFFISIGPVKQSWFWTSMMRTRKRLTMAFCKSEQNGEIRSRMVAFFQAEVHCMCIYPERVRFLPVCGAHPRERLLDFICPIMSDDSFGEIMQVFEKFDAQL